MTDPVKQTSVNGDYFERRRSGIGRLIFKIKRLFVQDVPKADAQCEFGCKRLECRQQEWSGCQNRIDESKK